MTANGDTVTVSLDRVAHARTGDKGDRSNIGIVAWHAELYPLLVAQLDEVRIAAVFADRAPSRVVRHLLPRLSSMNVVLDGALDGGVNDALNLDSHGKALSYRLLDLPMKVPRALLHRLAGPAPSTPG